MKHTSGTWKLGYDSGDTVEVVTLVSRPEGPGVEVIVAEVITEFEIPDGSDGEANARLIAAAPDLLAACEGALECLEDEGYEDGGEHYIVTRLKAAIARAKGGAT